MFFCGCVSSGFVLAQESFHEDSRNLDVKFDYSTYTGTVRDNETDSTKNTSASAIVLTPQMSWALGSAVSIGSSLGLSHYLDTAGTSVQMNGLDANFIFDLHFVRAPKVDMMLGLKMGVSGIRLYPADGTDDIYGSSGLTGDLHLMARFYVSEHLAILAGIGLPGYIFNKFGKNLNETSLIRLNGFSIGTGIAIKLLNQRTSGSARYM